MKTESYSFSFFSSPDLQLITGLVPTIFRPQREQAPMKWKDFVDQWVGHFWPLSRENPAVDLINGERHLALGVRIQPPPSVDRGLPFVVRICGNLWETVIWPAPGAIYQ